VQLACPFNLVHVRIFVPQILLDLRLEVRKRFVFACQSKKACVFGCIFYHKISLGIFEARP